MSGILKKLGLVFLCTAFLVGCNLPMKPPPSPTIETAAPLTFAPPPVIDTATPVPPTVDDFFARCPTAEEVASVNADLTLKFEYDPTAGTLTCQAANGSADLTRMQKRVYLSILVMRELKFDQPLPWTNKQLYQWFVESIKGIRFRNDIQNSSCCDPANVINIAVAANSFLSLTDKWMEPTMGGGLMDTMILFVHEARHNNGYPHTCSDGCSDQTMAEMGAWAVQVYLEEWIAQHGDRAFLTASAPYPNYYREIALGDSITIRNTRFCGEPTVAPDAVPTLVP